MRQLTLLLLLVAAYAAGMAQTVVDGTVSDAANGAPLPGVNVIVKNPAGRLVGFSSSDADGRFSLRLREAGDSLAITATMLGFSPYSAPLVLDGRPVEIVMEEGATQLREVVVKADRIRENGDTITYSVGSFAQKQDRSIGDVLRRMPGIDVADNGKIQYQGTDINKFYIEGSDLLGGKYGIATNGISHEDIGAVEVMENHQPMQVLRGLSFTDQAAINLRMKDRAKATFLVHGNLGGGWSRQPRGALWKGDIFTMMVAGRYQTITTLKGNNTGANLSDQLTDFTSDRSEETMTGYISLSAPSTPNLQRNRSYLNRSWMVSSSHLLKTGKGELKAQVDYSHDRVTAQGTSATTYFLETGDRVILEDRNSLSRRNALAGKFSLEINEKAYFLSNTLTADLSWNDLRLNTAGTLPNTQMEKSPEYSVTNLLKLIRRYGSRLVTFTSRNEWNSLPERLTVSHDGRAYGQRIGQRSVYTDERASLGFVMRRVLLTLEAGATGYFRRLDTDLWGVDNAGINGGEELTTDYLRIFAAPKLEWGQGKLEMTLGVPVNMYSYFFSGGLRNRTEFFISPSLGVRYRITPRMAVTLRGSARRSPAPLHNIHDSSILTDYRSLGTGVDDYYTSSGQTVSATYSFRNAQRGIFLTAMGSYGWNRSRFGTVQEVIGDYILHSYRARPTDSRNAMAMLNASKTLDFIRGSVGVRGNYMMSRNDVLSQGVATGYRRDSYTVTPFVSGNVSSVMNWDLRLTWDRSVLGISGMESRRADNLIYSGSLTLTPCSLVTWTAGGEFYRNQIEAGRYKEMLMLDTRLTLNVSKRIEITASVSNILNRRTYSYTTYGTLSQYERSSQLRGREFLISIYLKK